MSDHVLVQRIKRNELLSSSRIPRRGIIDRLGRFKPERNRLPYAVEEQGEWRSTEAAWGADCTSCEGGMLARRKRRGMLNN